jgi:hypothetical protein
MKFIRAIPCLVATAVLAAQTVAPSKSILGNVTGFKAHSSEIALKPDNGDAILVKFSPDTEVMRIAPGQHDLTKAAPAKITDIRSGDRLMVSYAEGMPEARRIVLISAVDITARNEADQRAWDERGIWGVVTAKNSNEITLRLFQGAQTGVVTVTSKTKFRRYAPDSIKFEDARQSNAADLATGDQVRARGERSSDGLKVTAEDLVFGTFVTVAGDITAVDGRAHEFTMTDLMTKKPVTVKVASDSMLKTLDFSHGPGPHGGGGGGPFASQSGMTKMLGQMPDAQFDDLKAGVPILVTSTKGAQSGRVTAIMLLNNAAPLVQMLQQVQSMAGAGATHGVDSMHAGIISAEGFSLPGMLR